MASKSPRGMVDSDVSGYTNLRQDVVARLLEGRARLEADTQDAGIFVVLRKWSSTLPRLAAWNPDRGTTPGDMLSAGGGYYLEWHDYGLVIDPGFHFIDNFWLLVNRPFSNIDGIVLTHAHSDHCHDFEPLLDLAWERNRQVEFATKLERSPGEDAHQLDLYLNQTSMNKYASMLTRGDALVRERETISPGGRYGLRNRAGQHVMNIVPTKAQHHDDYGSETVGLIIELLNPSTGTCVSRIGITSDTGWFEGLAEQFEGVDLLIPHLALVGKDDLQAAVDGDLKRLKANLANSRQHLGLCGALQLVHDAKPMHGGEPGMVVLSEFCEQSGEHDLRLFCSQFVENTMSAAYSTGIRCLAGEMGLRLSLPSLAVYCDSMKRFTHPTIFQQSVLHPDRQIRCCCSNHSQAAPL